MMFRAGLLGVLFVAGLTLTQPPVRWAKAAEQEPDDGGSLDGVSDSSAGLSPKLATVRDRLRSCLTYYYQRHEDAGYRSPWGIMHTLVA